MAVLKKYNSLDTIPVWNLHNLMNTGDLHYLLKDDDFYIFLNEVQTKELKAISEKIFSEMPKIDLTIQVLYYFCLDSYFNFLSKNGTIQDVNTAFSKYLVYLDSHYENFCFGEKIFEKASDLYKHIKEFSDYDDLLFMKIEFFDYNKIKADSKNKLNLLYEVAVLRDITNNQIDIYRTSFKEFLEIRNYAESKIKANGQKNRI